MTSHTEANAAPVAKAIKARIAGLEAELVHWRKLLQDCERFIARPVRRRGAAAPRGREKQLRAR